MPRGNQYEQPKIECWAQITFLQQDPLKKRILVTEHKAFIGSSSMALLQGCERFLILLDRCLELLYIFGSTFAKSSLSLAVSLLPLF